MLQGVKQGLKQGVAHSLIEVYEARFGAMPEDLRAVVEDIDDEPTLVTWLRLVGTRSADEIAAAIRSFRDVVDLLDGVLSLKTSLSPGSQSIGQCSGRSVAKCYRRFASTASATISRVTASFSIAALPYAMSMRCSRDGVDESFPSEVSFNI
jgi:hypothetical protein